MVCAKSKASDQPAHYVKSDQSLEYSMTAKLLTDKHLEFLSLKGGCTGSSESTLVKMPHCWKSHVAAHIKKGRFGADPVSVGGCVGMTLSSVQDIS